MNLNDLKNIFDLFANTVVPNVGIGTTNPRTLFNIKGPNSTTNNVANEYMHIGSNEQTANGFRVIGFGYLTSETYSPAYIGFQDTSVAGSGKGDLVFGTRDVTSDTAPSERMRINGAGNVGVGTTSPSNRLDVRDTQASNAVSYIYNTNTGASAEGLRVQIDAATPGTSNLYASFRKSGGTVIGSITGDGAGGVQYNLASDRRLKGNIRDTHYSIEDLLKIRVRDYHYIGHDVDTNGFIAQELYEAYPHAVTKPVDESKQYWQVDYGRLTPLLVKSIQDVHGRCEMTASQQSALAARVAAHDQEIDSLKREVQSLREKNRELEDKVNRILERLAQ